MGKLCALHDINFSSYLARSTISTVPIAYMVLTGAPAMAHYAAFIMYCTLFTLVSISLPHTFSYFTMASFIILAALEPTQA